MSRKAIRDCGISEHNERGAKTVPVGARLTSRTPPGNDLGRTVQHRLSHFCATNVGDLTITGLPAAEEGVGTDQGRHQ